MYIFHLFRSFIPALNPIGFSAADFIELIVTLLLRPDGIAPIRQASRRENRLVHAPSLSLLPIALRLALLPQYPIPTLNMLRTISATSCSPTRCRISASRIRRIRCTNSSRLFLFCSSLRTVPCFRSAKA